MRRFTKSIKQIAFISLCCSCFLVTILVQDRLIVIIEQQTNKTKNISKSSSSDKQVSEVRRLIINNSGQLTRSISATGEVIIRDDYDEHEEKEEDAIIKEERRRTKELNYEQDREKFNGYKFKPKFMLSNQVIDKLSERNEFFQIILGNKNSGLLLNYTNVTYLIEPSKKRIECTKKSGSKEKTRTLLIVVNSKWSNFRRREQMRSSWLNDEKLMKQVCNNGRVNGVISRVEYLFALASGQSSSSSSSSSSSRKLLFSAVGGGQGQVGGQNERELINEESRKHKDLLVMNLKEDYRHSMSLKHLSIFKWFLSSSGGGADGAEGQRGRFPADTLLLKCDDDAQIDLAQMLDVYLANELHHHHQHHHSETAIQGFEIGALGANAKLVKGEDEEEKDPNWIMCARFPANSRVLRSSDRKWRLTRRDYPFDTFPAYCSGLAYLAPKILVRRLLVLAHLILGEQNELELQQQQQQQQQLQQQQRSEYKMEKSELNNKHYSEPLWVDDVFVTGILPASLASSLRVVRLNAYFCYTRAHQARRAKLNAPCMVSERISI